LEESDHDVQLMLAFQRGDARAFDALFERWAARLVRFLERMVEDRASAEELAQEAFLRVHRARERYEPGARFSTWLYRIATNLALNELRRPRRRHSHASTGDEQAGLSELRASEPAADTVVDARRRSEALVRELALLPERQRTALWLAAGEGLSYAEVADVLETTTKSVKSLVHRARATLTARLGASGHPKVEAGSTTESTVRKQP